MRLSEKSILIFSTAEDKSTNKVMQHLADFHVPVFRFNDNKYDVRLTEDSSLNILLENKNVLKFTPENCVIWYRTGSIVHRMSHPIKKIDQVNSKEV